MRRPISPRLHGVLDYSTSAAIALAPRLLDFPRPARRLADTLATGYTGMSAVTDYPLGAKRVLPFKAHGAMELVIGAALPAMPSCLDSPVIVPHAISFSGSPRSPSWWPPSRTGKSTTERSVLR